MTRWRVVAVAAGSAAVVVECVPEVFTEPASVAVLFMPDVSTAEDASRVEFAQAIQLLVVPVVPLLAGPVTPVVPSRGAPATPVAQSLVILDGTIHGVA